MAITPRTKKVARRFGGRATAGGVNYEVRVAALIAVHMLAGDRCMIWDGVGGDAVGAITLQANNAVDDVVATLPPLGSRAFIQAKDRRLRQGLADTGLPGPPKAGVMRALAEYKMIPDAELEELENEIAD